MAALLTLVLAIAVTGFFFFILGKNSGDRKRTLNHHQMMMLLMDIRTKDDIMPFLSDQTRIRANAILDDYERLDLNDDRGATTITTIAGVAVVVAAATLVIVTLWAVLNPGPRLEEGMVVDKVYDDADDNYVPGYTIDGGQSCTGGYNGQPRVCTDNPDTNVPGYWDHDPERFLLELEGPHPDDPAKTISDEISVPESFWNEVKIGQWVDVDSLEIIPR